MRIVATIAIAIFDWSMKILYSKLAGDIAMAAGTGLSLFCRKESGIIR